MNKDEALENIVQELRGKEHQFIEDFFKSFIAHQMLNKENISLIFEKYEFCIQHSFKIGSPSIRCFFREKEKQDE